MNSDNIPMSLISKIDRPLGYNFIVILSMVYMSIMLCNAILTNRYIGTDHIYFLGGTLTSPFIFILDDIIAEIYGYKIARSVIITGFAAQTLFIVICQMVIKAPHPSFFKEEHIYAFVLGASLLRINISGFIAYITANLINSYIITRWKILVKGKYFWLRSIGSSSFSEALYSLIAILMMEFNSIPLHDIFQVVIISFSIKLIYSIIFSYPANLLVDYLKMKTGIDIYDHKNDFTPFQYMNVTRLKV